VGDPKDDRRVHIVDRVFSGDGLRFRRVRVPIQAGEGEQQNPDKQIPVHKRFLFFDSG
jgi:hypothetical protein